MGPWEPACGTRPSSLRGGIERTLPDAGVEDMHVARRPDEPVDPETAGFYDRLLA